MIRNLIRIPHYIPKLSVIHCKLYSQCTSPQLSPLTILDKQYPAGMYGGRQTVTMITGDGIGPEMLRYVKEVFYHAEIPVDFEEIELNRSSSEEVMERTLLAVKRNGVAIKGNMNTAEGTMSKNLFLRRELDLFAYITRCANVPGVTTRHDNVDIIIIRENSEGEYAQLEHENVKGVVESLKIMTEFKCRQIAEFAFNYAVTHNRKKVTAVHKANIMKLGDGLFLEQCGKVAKHFPNIEFEGMIVDNCSMQMVSNPQQFDVLLTPNLYGNIVGNIAASLVGGPGVVWGVNIGHKYALFETGTRNSGRTLTGKNIANPVAMLLAATKMLRHIGLKEEGQRIHNAIWHVVGVKGIKTPDIGGNNQTSEMIESIIELVKRK